MVAVENLLTVAQLDDKIKLANEKIENCKDNYLKAKLQGFVNRCLDAKQKIISYRTKLVAKHPALKNKKDFLESITVFDTKNPKKVGSGSKLNVSGKIDDPLGKMSTRGTLAEWFGDHKGIVAGIGYTAAALQVANTITIATAQQDIGKLLWEGLKAVFGSQIGRGLVFAGALAGATTLLLKLPSIQRNMLKKKLAKLERKNTRMNAAQDLVADINELDQRSEKGLRTETMLKMASNPKFEEKIIAALDEKINSGKLSNEQKLFAIAQKNQYIKFKNERMKEQNEGARQVEEQKTKMAQNASLESLVATGVAGRPNGAAEQEAKRSELEYRKAMAAYQVTIPNECKSAEEAYKKDPKVAEITEKYKNLSSKTSAEISALENSVSNLSNDEAECKKIDNEFNTTRSNLEKTNARIEAIEGKDGKGGELANKRKQLGEIDNALADSYEKKATVFEDAKKAKSSADKEYTSYRLTQYNIIMLTRRQDSPEIKEAEAKLGTLADKKTKAEEAYKTAKEAAKKAKEEKEKKEKIQKEIKDLEEERDEKKKLKGTLEDELETIKGKYSTLATKLSLEPIEGKSLFQQIQDKKKELQGELVAKKAQASKFEEDKKKELSETEAHKKVVSKNKELEEAEKTYHVTMKVMEEKVTKEVIQARKAYRERLKIAQSLYGADVADLVLNSTFDKEGNVVSLSTIQPGSTDVLSTSTAGGSFPEKLTVECYDKDGKLVKNTISIKDRAAFDALLERVKAARQQILNKQQEQGLASE